MSRFPALRLGIIFVGLFLAFFSQPTFAALDDDSEELGERFDSVFIPEGLTKESIRDGLAAVLSARGWTVRKKSDRRVIGYLKHRGNEATVSLVFDGEQLEIYCVGWAINRQGERKKPEQPRGWLGILKRDITRKFAAMSVST